MLQEKEPVECPHCGEKCTSPLDLQRHFMTNPNCEVEVENNSVGWGGDEYDRGGQQLVNSTGE